MGQPTVEDLPVQRLAYQRVVDQQTQKNLYIEFLFDTIDSH